MSFHEFIQAQLCYLKLFLEEIVACKDITPFLFKKRV